MQPPASATPAELVPPVLALAPAWARRPFETSQWQSVPGPSGNVLSASTDEGLCAVTASVPRAATLGREAFERVTKEIYAEMLERLLRDAFQPLRWWNFIPGINEELEPGLSRYLAFNSARYEGYCAVHPGGALPGAIATASAVGAPDEGFHAYCVGTRDRAVPVENPRQVPAYEYSPKYGPVPPSFARAMLVGSSSPLLVIGGTASVRGEDSVHAGDLPAQLDETLLNVRTLIDAGCTAAGRHRRCAALAALVSLRAYVVDGAAAPATRDVLADACGLPASVIELRVADLCRPDLLVEVEGVAALDRITGASG